MFPKIGVLYPPPNHPFVHRVWNHYFHHHPFWGVNTPILGNTHIIHPRSLTVRPCKMVVKEDFCLSHWVSVTFQGRAVKLREGMPHRLSTFFWWQVLGKSKRFEITKQGWLLFLGVFGGWWLFSRFSTNLKSATDFLKKLYTCMHSVFSATLYNIDHIYNYIYVYLYIYIQIYIYILFYSTLH